MSIHFYNLSPLGYQAATDLGLSRTEEGIISQSEGKLKFFGLLNYPTAVRFSAEAIRKMDTEYRKNDKHSTIKIYANLKSGKKITLFAININFFGRVQNDRNTSKSSLEYSVPPFKYDSSDKSFESVHASERSFYSFNSKDGETDSNDVVTSFGAEYLLGLFSAEERHEFAPEFVSADEFDEKILLKIGVKPNWEWDLTICQRSGISRSVTTSKSAAPITQEKNVSVPKPSNDDKIPEHFICPITLVLMTDPVIAPDGNSYERKDIVEWLTKEQNSPITRQPMTIEQFIENRGLKDAIAAYRKDNPFKE